MRSYRIDPETDERIENIVQYRPPFGNQLARYKQLLDEAKALACLIVSLTPKSREQSLSSLLTHLEEVVFFAKAAIDRHEKPDPVPQYTEQELQLQKFSGRYGGHNLDEHV